MADCSGRGIAYHDLNIPSSDTSSPLPLSPFFPTYRFPLPFSFGEIIDKTPQRCYDMTAIQEAQGVGVMRLSTKARYAVRSMVDLALHVNQGPVTREEIALRQEISAHYLARLFTKLVKARLISSVKGPGGGYLLAQSAAAITAGDIIRAVEEPLAPVYCVNAEVGKTCHRVDGCATHLLWKRLGERIAELLDSVTLEELREQAQQIQRGMRS